MSLQSHYEALRHGVARVSRLDRGVVRLQGADRVTWLQGLVTNDVLALEPGHRVYSAWLTPQGRMLTDLWVVAAPGALLLDVPATLAADLAARLDGLIFAEDVQIDDVSGVMACTEFVGASGRVGASAAGVVVEDHTWGRPALVVYGPADVVLKEPQHEAEALLDAVAVPLDALEVLRIEAGVPRFFVDMTTDTIPLEAGLEQRAISFTKGCYVGQEIIVRVTTRGGGRVAKKLVGLVFDEAVRTRDGQAAPQGDATRDLPMAPAGFRIRAGERATGEVTSITWSPVLGRLVALGYVHRDFVEPGTALTVDLTEGAASAEVRALPFVAS